MKGLMKIDRDHLFGMIGSYIGTIDALVKQDEAKIVAEFANFKICKWYRFWIPKTRSLSPDDAILHVRYNNWSDWKMQHRYQWFCDYWSYGSFISSFKTIVAHAASDAISEVYLCPEAFGEFLRRFDDLIQAAQKASSE